MGPSVNERVPGASCIHPGVRGKCSIDPGIEACITDPASTPRKIGTRCCHQAAAHVKEPVVVPQVQRAIGNTMLEYAVMQIIPQGITNRRRDVQ